MDGELDDLRKRVEATTAQLGKEIAFLRAEVRNLQRELRDSRSRMHPKEGGRP